MLHIGKCKRTPINAIVEIKQTAWLEWIEKTQFGITWRQNREPHVQKRTEMTNWRRKNCRGCQKFLLWIYMYINADLFYFTHFSVRFCFINTILVHDFENLKPVWSSDQVIVIFWLAITCVVFLIIICWVYFFTN